MNKFKLFEFFFCQLQCGKYFYLCHVFVFFQIRAHGPDALPEPVKAHLGDIAKEEKKATHSWAQRTRKLSPSKTADILAKNIAKTSVANFLLIVTTILSKTPEKKNLLNLWKNLSQTFYTTIFSELF